MGPRFFALAFLCAGSASVWNCCIAKSKQPTPWTHWWDREWQPKPASRSIGVRNERRKIPHRRLHCHVAHSRRLYWHVGATIQPVAPGVEGHRETKIDGLRCVVRIPVLKTSSLEIFAL